MKGRLRIVIAWVALWAAGSPASAQREDVYVDALGAGWQSWSWGGSYTFTNAAPVQAGAASIRSVQQAWGALSLHHASIPAGAYAYLEFFIHGGAAGGQLLRVQLEDDTTGGASAPVDVEDYLVGGVSVAAGAWTLVSIPLSAFALATPGFTRIDVADRSGTAQPAWYLDSMALMQSASAPSRLTSVRAGGARAAVAFFDSGVTPATATNPANYGLAGSNDAHYATRSTPTAAAYDAARWRVALSFTQDFVSGGRYTLYVNGVTNLAGTAVAADTHGSFGFSNRTVFVDALASNRAISPLIYGVAWAPGTNYLADSGATVHRWGGNHASTYNWLIEAKNSANDWYFENYPWSDPGDPTTPSNAVAFADWNAAAGVAGVLTLPLLPYVAKDRSSASFSVARYGPQQASDPYNANAGNGVSTGGWPIVNNPLDSGVSNRVSGGSNQAGVVYQNLWLRHIASNAAAGVDAMPFIAIENEMEIWSSTHRDWHPGAVTYDEIWSVFSNAAAMVRREMPLAKILGPVTCGWWYYWNTEAGDADKQAHGGVDSLPWFLARARQHEIQTGQRLLDYLDVHYYPDPSFGGATDAAGRALRLRATRELWDATYRSEGWIGSDLWATQTQPNRNYPQLIPRLKALVAQHYPGLPIALTEYNWGADATLNGALAFADCLGIFGREGLDMACAWTAPAADTPAYQVLKLYRNCGSSHVRFGNTSVLAQAGPPNLFTAYAARDLSGALSLIVVNKDPGCDYSAAIQFGGYIPAPTAAVYQVSAANLRAVLREPDLTTAGTNMTAVFPAYSVTHLRFSPRDSVGDGIADWWRALYFGGTGAATTDVSGAAGDIDRDGMSNLQEYRAGTDPTNGCSFLGMRVPAGDHERSSGRFVAQWSSVTGRLYALERSTDLVHAAFGPLATNIWATPPLNTATDSAAEGSGPYYYRVRLQP